HGLASQRTQSASLLIGAIQALSDKAYGGHLDNQFDVVGTETTGTFVYSAVAHSQWHYGEDVPLFIEDQPLQRGSVVEAAAKASLDYGDVKLLVDHYSQNNFADTHSLVLIADSLAVQNTLQSLAPTATLTDLTALFKAASNLTKSESSGSQGKAEGDVLENVVNALADTLLGPHGNTDRLNGSPEGNTWWITGSTGSYSGREALYAKLATLAQSDPYKSLTGTLTLLPSSAIAAEEAKTDFAKFAALYTLSPFVLGNGSALENAVKAAWGDTYTQWKADTDARANARLDLAFSDAWYDDRSRVASLWQQATTGNTTHLSGRGIDPQATLLNVDDRAHDVSLTVRASTADGGGERNSYLRFARNDGDLLAGDGLADHLFGGAGDGQIDTQRILTMHPTDFYHSAYRMSSSNDPWRQAA
ncbi:MAG TPA: hypothetical protein PKZ67_12360, partial [Accumulibacter sp.]|nr:hypothetical protein [Accumulibacter sp.]